MTTEVTLEGLSKTVVSGGVVALDDVDSFLDGRSCEGFGMAVALVHVADVVTLLATVVKPGRTG